MLSCPCYLRVLSACLCMLPDHGFTMGSRRLLRSTQPCMTLASFHILHVQRLASQCLTSAANREVAACLRGPLWAGLRIAESGKWATSSFISNCQGKFRLKCAASKTSQPWPDLCICMTLWLEWSHLSATMPPSSALRTNRIWKRTVRPSMPAPTSGSAASMLALVTPGVLRVTKRRPRGLTTCTAGQTVAEVGPHALAPHVSVAAHAPGSQLMQRLSAAAAQTPTGLRTAVRPVEHLAAAVAENPLRPPLALLGMLAQTPVFTLLSAASACQVPSSQSG